MSTSFDAVLAQYEKTKKMGAPAKISQEDRLKKYFTLLLPDKEKEGTKRVRILPTADGSSPFKEVYYHEIQVGGSWVKLYDPGKNDNEMSPLNEVYEELMASKTDTDAELAKQYKSRLFYVVKVIDPDAPEDGVKFWRFKHNYKNEGILDKIIPIWRQKGDITHSETGRNLIINMVKTKTNKGKEYTSVSSIIYDDPSLLSDDKEIADQWINDPMTHKDVYARKPLEYLEAIARGDVPTWNKDKGGWDYRNSTAGESSFGGSGSNSSGDNDDFDSDDLPF